jgi:TRAP-type uncharacterized transport system substrate-binding protein
MRRIILLGLAVGFALVGLVGLGVYLYDGPTVLRVAVERDSQEEAIMAAAGLKFARERAAVRFKFVPVDDLADSARALEQGRADVSVIRSDVAVPANSASVLIMHTDLVLFVAPAGSDLRAISELKGHKIGILRDTPSARGVAHPGLIDVIFGQYDVPTDTITTVPITTADIGRVIADKTVDAILAIGTPDGGPLAETVSAVTAAGHGDPVFLPVTEAKAIAQRLPLFEASDVVRGVFPGAQPRPSRTIETLAASTHLVVKLTLANDVAASITRLMLAARPELALRHPAANRIEAPSTDKDVAMMAHPGSVEYIDDTEQSFFDKYSDAIYISALCLSALGTVAAALASRIKINRDTPEDQVLARLVEIVKASRTADPATLDRLEAEADDLLASALTPEALRLKTEAQRIHALGMAFDHTRHALREQRNKIVSPTRPALGPRIVRD